MVYGQSVIRNDVYAVVNAVSNVGKVYKQLKLATLFDGLLDTFKTTISGTEQIRSWMITVTGLPVVEDDWASSSERRDCVVKIAGLMGVDDSAATEIAFATLVEAVCNALDADTTLHSDKYFNATPASAPVLGYQTFGGLLVHWAEIELTITEVI